jgi:hypothetical protein
MVARDAAAGAVMGFAATVPMILAMTGMYRRRLPTAGLYRPAPDESVPRKGVMLAAHLIWGASLGLGFHAARRRETDGGR